MTTNDFATLSSHEPQDPPHRAASRAPAEHHVTIALAGTVCVACVFAVLWALYAFG
jgi:hypothetical protein